MFHLGVRAYPRDPVSSRRPETWGGKKFRFFKDDAASFPKPMANRNTAVRCRRGMGNKTSQNQEGTGNRELFECLRLPRTEKKVTSKKIGLLEGAKAQ